MGRFPTLDQPHRPAVDRCKTALGLERDQDLARHLSVSHAAPYNWATRGLPPARAQQIADLTARMPAWLLRGEGGEALTPADRTQGQTPIPTLPDHLRALIAALPPGTQATVTLPDGHAVHITLAAPAA